jgi:RNA polymerase sporulation-specific sigma factor
MTDEKLVELAKESPEALETLLLRHTRLVRSCARPLFLSGGDHEDLVQEGMIGLLAAIRSYRNDCGSTFRSYAAVCIRSRLISAVRSASAKKHAPLNESVSLQTFSFETLTDVSLESDPEESFIVREGFDEFMQALQQQLSAAERQVLQFYLEGLSYAEIAQKLHKSVKSVDNAVQRIRMKAAKIHGENGNPV